jgi:hypothetical protein
VGSTPTGVSFRHGPLVASVQRRGGFPISTRLGIVDLFSVFRTWCLNGRDQFRLAQWEEHQTDTLAVAGSNPVPTSKQLLAKTAGAIGLRCGAGGGSSFV